MTKAGYTMTFWFGLTALLLTEKKPNKVNQKTNIGFILYSIIIIIIIIIAIIIRVYIKMLTLLQHEVSMHLHSFKG